MKIFGRSGKFIFIILALAVLLGAVGFWYWRDSIFSKQILRLEILGQESAKMGDEITYTVKYKNNGNFVLENPSIIFQLPEYSLTEDGKTRIIQSLKDIYPGDENFVKFSTRLLGKEGDLKVARALLSYRPHNLSVRYESETTFTTKIETVPVNLTLDLPSRAEKAKEISYSINYFSNIDYPLENLSVKVDTVEGFAFKSSEPLSLDHAEWKLKTLNKAQGGRIVIKGGVSGEAGGHLNFLVRLGIWQNGTFIIIKEVEQTVEVIQPLLFISQQVNGFSDYIASPGEKLHYEVFFRNIGTTPFEDLFIISRLDGKQYDLTTLQSASGQARANDNLIVWDSKQIPELRRLFPKQEVKVDFTIMLKDSWVASEAEKNNTVVKNKVNVLDMSQEFTTKVNAKLELSQKAYHASSPGIENSGPVPPKAGVATSYTIIWQIKNSFNDAKNVKVKVLLPTGITLGDVIVPEDQASNFSFDTTSREVVWLVGTVIAGTGIISGPLSLSFQVSLTPSLSQRGAFASLIGQVTVTGEDQLTGAVIQNTAPSINTSLPDDQANSGGGIVQ